MRAKARNDRKRRVRCLGIALCASGVMAASAVAFAATPAAKSAQPTTPAQKLPPAPLLDVEPLPMVDDSDDFKPSAAITPAPQVPSSKRPSAAVQISDQSNSAVQIGDQLEYPTSARKAWVLSHLLQPDEPRNPLAQPTLPAPGEQIPAGRGDNRGINPPGYGDTAVRPISSLTVNILPSRGDVPKETNPTQLLEREFGNTEFRRAPLDYCYYWESPAFFNRPLYFEQPNLERYGYTWGPAQPFISAAQFWVKIPLLPYMMTVHCPNEPIYSLGYYRPGSRAPYQINWPEVRLDAITVETAFITGLCFLIP